MRWRRSDLELIPQSCPEEVAPQSGAWELQSAQQRWPSSDPFQASADEVRVTVQSDATLARVKEALAKTLDRPRVMVEARFDGGLRTTCSPDTTRSASEQDCPSSSG